MKFNRQPLDFILTDLLPYEKGNHYTHRFFYDYLHENKMQLKGLLKEISKSSECFNKNWHSAPNKFKISKNNGGFRELSLINPLGIIESYVFISIFENDIINILQNKNDFSVRKANRTNSLTYKNHYNQTVYYNDNSVSKEQLLISLESSGTYFKHYPFKSITNLLNDRRFLFSRDKYQHLLVIDIQECFPSIYTHSYKWLMAKKTYDSKKLNSSNTIYKNIDTFLQNINGSKTNGIIVGPEISRLLVEFLFVHIDQLLKEDLSKKGLEENIDYRIYRFVDDFYIFTHNVRNQEIIKEEIAVLLNRFQLKINDLKIAKYSKEANLNSWIIEVQPTIHLIEAIFKNEIDKLLSEVKKAISKFSSLYNEEGSKESLLEVASSVESIREVNVTSLSGRKVKYRDLRNHLIHVLNSCNEISLICSYSLSSILKNIEEYKNDKLLINAEANELITFVFFVYTKNITYSSTQKLIRILSLLIEKEVDGIIDMIERNFERFEKDIFSTYIKDWIDIVLFLAIYNVKISKTLIDEITNRIILEGNPVNLAALCLYYESDYIKSNSFVRKVNDLIKVKTSKINWDDFFDDELSWWVFIFLSYPKLRANNKQLIVSNLRLYKNKLKNNSADNAKFIVLEFLLKSKKHLIEWDFRKDNYYKTFFFYTKDRTVFNPDILDQLSISR